GRRPRWRSSRLRGHARGPGQGEGFSDRRAPPPTSRARRDGLTAGALRRATVADVVEATRPGLTRHMRWIPGGRFAMGSDHHYPEEAPVREVAVDGFWIDEHPVTNLEFLRFVKATGHVTSAERVPDADDYPGALPELLFAGSVVFQKTAGPVDLTDAYQWWTWRKG